MKIWIWIGASDRMFTYEFKCGHGHTFTTHNHVATEICHCGGIAKRMYTPFRMNRVQIEPIFNPSLGRTVTSERDMREGFKIASDSASERLGYDINYTPVDLSEPTSLNVTSEGLSSDKLRAYDKKAK